MFLVRSLVLILVESNIRVGERMTIRFPGSFGSGVLWLRLGVVEGSRWGGALLGCFRKSCMMIEFEF